MKEETKMCVGMIMELHWDDVGRDIDDVVITKVYTNSKIDIGRMTEDLKQYVCEYDTGYKQLNACGLEVLKRVLKEGDPYVYPTFTYTLRKNNRWYEKGKKMNSDIFLELPLKYHKFLEDNEQFGMGIKKIY